MKEISQFVPKGRHAVVVMDGAMWHQPSLNLDNVTMLKLPPYSPELSPAEQVWQYMKQHWLSNRCFVNYEDIVETVCSVLNEFSEQLDLVKSVTARNWCLLQDVLWNWYSYSKLNSL